MPGARLTGRVTLHVSSQGDGPSLGEDGSRALPGVVIELSQGEHSFVRRTDHNGVFRFAGMSAGHWVLQVHDRGLPERAVVENAVRVIELAPEDEVDLSIPVRLVNRQIQIIDAGEMSLQVSEPVIPEVWYTVSPGDTLSRIAAKQLGNMGRWAEIYGMNRDEIGAQPNYIVVGQRLKIPPS